MEPCAPATQPSKDACHVWHNIWALMPVTEIYLVFQGVEIIVQGQHEESRQLSSNGQDNQY